jgi:hypothetical protein
MSGFEGRSTIHCPFGQPHGYLHQPCPPRGPRQFRSRVGANKAWASSSSQPASIMIRLTTNPMVIKRVNMLFIPVVPPRDQHSRRSLLPSKSKGCSGEATFVASPRKRGTEKDLRIGRMETVRGRGGKCQRPGAHRRAQTPRGGHYSGREMPSFLIFHCNVERFMPRRVAAPFGPPSTQSVSRRAPLMCSRSASASVTAAAVGTGA